MLSLRKVGLQDQRMLSLRKVGLQDQSMLSLQKVGMRVDVLVENVRVRRPDARSWKG